MPEPTNPLVRSEVTGADPDSAIEVFRGAYDGGGDWSARATDWDVSFRHTAVGDADLTLRTTTFRGRITGEIAPDEDYVVAWLTGGRGTVDSTRDRLDLEIGRPFIFPTNRPFAFDMADFDQKLVHIRKPVLERVAAELHGTPPGTLDLETTPPDDAAVRSWRNTLALVSRTVLDAEASPVLKGEITRLAAVAMLGLFTPCATGLPAPLRAPSNARLRVAVEFIHANAHLPITTTAVATAAGLSIRALQEGFRRHLDCTPNAYLRDVRLGRVHDELRSGAAGTVAPVARAWGFAHLGRFAAQYAERFGELPHATIRDTVVIDCAG